MSDKSKAFLLRFTKGFLAGGMASIAIIFQSATNVSTVSDLKKFGISLLIAFFTGGFLAVEKMATWQEVQS